MEHSKPETAFTIPGQRIFLRGRRRLIILIAICAVAVAAVVIGIVLLANKKEPSKLGGQADEKAIYTSIAHNGKDVTFSSSVETSQKVDYYVSEAWILRGADRQDDALAMLREGEKLADGGAYPQLYAAFGDFYKSRGDKVQAKAYYEKALAAVDASQLEDKGSFKQLYQEELKGL